MFPSGLNWVRGCALVFCVKALRIAVDSQGGEGLIIQKLQFLPRFDLSDLERSVFFFFN